MDKDGLAIMGFIPARAQSKGIQNKHLRKLGNKRVIEYTIEAACASQMLDRVIVSTDSEEIAELALNNGAEVPFLRPAEIAGDNSDIGDAITHLISYLENTENYSPDILVALYPTSPFRRQGLIDRIIEDFLSEILNNPPEDIEVVQLIACSRIFNEHSYYYSIDNNDNLLPYRTPRNGRTKPEGKLYRISGSIGVHVYSLDVWRHKFQVEINHLNPLNSPTGNDYWENVNSGKPMRREPFVLTDIEAVDLDEPIDFFRAIAVNRHNGK